MKLHVSIALPASEDEFIEQDITSFDDIDRIGARVAGATRRWLRSLQVRKGVQRESIVLTGTFEEHTLPAAGSDKPRRRKRKAASNGAKS